MNLGRLVRPGEATFDLTPMIDVVLLLIIFFMLSSQFSRNEASFVDLPTEPGERGGASEHRATFIVDVNARGDYLVMGQWVPLQDMARVLGAGTTPPDVMEKMDVLVRADRACPAQAINRLSGVLSRAGVRSFRLATRPPEDAGGRAAPARGGGGT